MSEATKSYLQADGSGKIWQVVELGGDTAIKLPLEKRSGQIKWFDDSRLVRKKLEETHEQCHELSGAVNELQQFEICKSYDLRNPDTIYWLEEVGKHLRILYSILSDMNARA